MNVDSYRGIGNPAPVEYARLTQALEAVGSHCADDDRFIQDGINADALAPICGACPVFVLCSEYAAKAKPSGVWAGRRWTGPPNQHTRKATA